MAKQEKKRKSYDTPRSANSKDVLAAVAREQEMVAVVQGTTTCIFICAEDVPALKKGQRLHVTHFGDGSMHIMPGIMEPPTPSPAERLRTLEKDISYMGNLLTAASTTLREVEAQLRAGP